MPVKSLFPVLLSLLILPAVCMAGNKWMMEKNGNELLMLHAKLLQKLDAIKEDGRIVLKGNVVIRDGKTMLQLEELEHFSPEKQQAPRVEQQDDAENYHVFFLKEEDLTDIVILDENTSNSISPTQTPTNEERNEKVQ